jgi:hypothetical protein
MLCALEKSLHGIRKNKIVTHTKQKGSYFRSNSVHTFERLQALTG